MLRPSLVALALFLSGCAPTMYVPHPVSSPPLSVGVVASGEVEMVSRAALDLAVRPIEAISFHGRVSAGDMFSDEPERFTGGEGGVTFQFPLGTHRTQPISYALVPSIEFGGALGRDQMQSNGVSGVTDRASGHVGLVWSNPERHIGLIARVTSVYTYDVGEYDREDTGVFFEPILRFGHLNGRMEIGAQAGLSLDLRSDDYYRFSYIPLISSVRLGYHLGIIGTPPNIPPAVPSVPTRRDPEQTPEAGGVRG